ncbi:MAG: hypothetical protein KGQ70_08645, partial [Alphaproteobacteria bacterium]|nr:hypothetical protein [Alphaproteobacteria bacterium]
YALGSTSASGAVGVIDKAQLTVAADNKTVSYGAAALPALKDTITGFVNGENSGLISGTASLTTTATAYNGMSGSGSHVGSYVIDAGLGTLSAQNYAFAFVNGTLKVTPVALKVAANNASMTYGGAAPALTDTITGFVNGDTASSLTTQPTVTSGTAFTANAGTYAGTITASGAVDPDYTISYTPGTLTINPAQTLNFIADVYGTNTEIGPLQRPIISVADRTINYDPPFEPSPTQAGNIKLSIGDRTDGVSLADITPAAGGNEGMMNQQHSLDPADLANITPAAGGNSSATPANNNDFSCAAAFLEGADCVNQ